MMLQTRYKIQLTVGSTETITSTTAHTYAQTFQNTDDRLLIGV